MHFTVVDPEAERIVEAPATVDLPARIGEHVLRPDDAPVRGDAARSALLLAMAGSVTRRSRVLGIYVRDERARTDVTVTVVAAHPAEPGVAPYVSVCAYTVPREGRGSSSVKSTLGVQADGQVRRGYYLHAELPGAVAAAVAYA